MIQSAELSLAEVIMIFHKRTWNLVTFLLFDITSPLKSKEEARRKIKYKKLYIKKYCSPLMETIGSYEKRIWNFFSSWH